MGNFDEPKGWKRVVLVGHQICDFDCLLGISLAAQGLADLGFRGKFEVVFVPVGSTYRPEGNPNEMHVYQDQWYEVIRPGEVAIHVDVGKSALDHHSPLHPAASSATLVDWAFKVTEKHSEWAGLVGASELAERGQLKGSLSINGILDGQHRVLGPGKDLAVYHLFTRLLLGFLANAKVGIEARKVAPEKVRQFNLGDGAPERQIVRVNGFGTVGLIMAPLDKLGLLGSIRTQMERGGCRLVISTCADRTAIMSCMPSAQNRHIDLAEWNIVAEVRRAEAEKRRIEMSEADFAASLAATNYSLCWMAHQVVDQGSSDPRIANLFNGTSKTPPPEGQRTVLTTAEVIEVVLRCLLAGPVRFAEE